nr:hypothetical protein [Streptomyces humi]
MLALGRVQGVERLLELVAHPNVAVQVLVDVQRLEERLVQPAALLIVAAPVQRLRILQKLQARLDDLCSCAEVFVDVVEPGRQAIPLLGDVSQLGLDLALGQAAVGCQVDEVALLGVERTKLFRELGLEELGRGLLFVDHGGQMRAHGRDELWCEAHCGVVVFDGFLDLFDRDVRQLTNVIEAAVAEEVPIDVAVPVGGVLDDHAALFASAATTGAAEQRTLQLVVMHAPSLTSVVSGVGDLLYAVEEVLRDKGSMTPLVLLALVGDPAAVVVVAQDDVQSVGGDPPFFGVPGVAGHAQPTVVQFLRHFFHGVLTGGIQLERQADEGAAYSIDGDGANPAVVDEFDGVQVPDRGAGDRAAVASLVGHFGLDVLAALADCKPVENIGYRLHGLGHIAIAEVLFGGHQLDAELLKLPLGDGGVDVVSEDA